MLHLMTHILRNWGRGAPKLWCRFWSKVGRVWNWKSHYLNSNNNNNNKKKTFKKKLCSPFLWMGFNCLKATATLRRQFTVTVYFLHYFGLFSCQNIQFLSIENWFQQRCYPYWFKEYLTERSTGIFYLEKRRDWFWLNFDEKLCQ